MSVVTEFVNLLSVVPSCLDVTCGISILVFIICFVFLYVRELGESVFIIFVVAGFILWFLSLSLSPVLFWLFFDSRFDFVHLILHILLM